MGIDHVQPNRDQVVRRSQWAILNLETGRRIGTCDRQIIADANTLDARYSLQVRIEFADKTLPFNALVVSLIRQADAHRQQVLLIETWSYGHEFCKATHEQSRANQYN